MEEKQEIITKEEAEKMMKEDANIRTRNVRIGWGTIALLSTLTACGIGIIFSKYIHRPKNSFTYKVDHDGKIQVSGKVKYDEITSWYLLEKQLNKEKSKLYIIDLDIKFDPEFVDIHTDKKIASAKIIGDPPERFSDATILNVKHLESYLFTYDMVYDSYTIEDMDQLLGLIEADYEYAIPDESNKVMMKTNEQTVN